MVSIIIPVYNAAPYIADTLESVLQSTYTDIEIVCMDDGSTDKSWSILKQYAEKDKRIRVFHQENAGVCKARNEAIAASHGEYILPIDADDLLLPQFISQAVSVLNSHQEVKVVAPTAEFFGERTGLWRLPTFNLRKEAHKTFSPLAPCIAAQISTVRAAIAKKLLPEKIGNFGSICSKTAAKWYVFPKSASATACRSTANA